jgi:hypothetical protein
MTDFDAGDQKKLVQVKVILEHTCNWCERWFETEPVFNDESKVYAFCSQNCADEMQRLTSQYDDRFYAYCRWCDTTHKEWRLADSKKKEWEVCGTDIWICRCGYKTSNEVMRFK